jgi:hypothetical protein
LQQEGEAADIITAPARTATAAIAKKNDEKEIVQTFSISAHNSKKWSF